MFSRLANGRETKHTAQGREKQKRAWGSVKKG